MERKSCLIITLISPDLPAPTASNLLPFIAPLQHPMLPSRPVSPPSLQAKIPPAVHCRTDGEASGKCSALELLAHNQDFSIFVSMLRLADLIDILSLPGPITVFAPTNEAFDGLPTPLFKVKTRKVTNLRTKCLIF